MYKARDDAQLKQIASEKPPSANVEKKSPFQIVSDMASTKSKEPEEGYYI